MNYHLTPLDLSVLGAFALAIVAITFRCARRADTTDDYFLAGQASPGWVVGLSFLGTSISSLSFLSFPAAAYQGNWGGLAPFLVIPLVAALADRVCIPLYRSTGVRSGYEYLELRFGFVARLYGSVMFLLLQLARVGLIMVLLSLPLTLLSGLDQSQTILICGVFTTLYVLFGGLSAVLWTDVLQTILLAAGAVFCAVWMCMQLPDGVATVIEVGRDAHKFEFPPWRVRGAGLLGDATHITLAVLLVHGLFNQLLYFVGDQNVIQRYLATGSARQARFGLWIGGLGIVPLLAFFTFLGTCLFAYYTVAPDPAVAQLAPDEVFPHFILTQLPPGVVGVILAALIAAAMSSLDSNLNAVSMVFQIDVYRRLLVRNRSDRHYLRVAKVMTLVFGGLVTLGALALASAPVETLLDLMFLVYSILAGGLASVFLLGMLTRRANAWGVNAGIAASLAASLYLTCSYFGWLVPERFRASTHPYLIGAISNSTLLAVGYLASVVCIRKSQRRRLGGLTVWTPKTIGDQAGGE